MCWVCDLVGSVAKIKKTKVSMGACSMLCGHNIDKYGNWIESRESFWDDEGEHIVILYPTKELVEETKKIYEVLALGEPEETDTLENLGKKLEHFFRQESYKSDPAEIAKKGGLNGVGKKT